MNNNTVIKVDFQAKQVVGSAITESQIDGMLSAAVVEVLKKLPKSTSILNIRPSAEGDMLRQDLNRDNYWACTNFYIKEAENANQLIDQDGQLVSYNLMPLHHDFIKEAMKWCPDPMRRPHLAQMLFETLISHVAEGGALVMVLPVELKANYYLRSFFYFEEVAGFDMGYTDDNWTILACRKRNSIDVPGPHYWLSLKEFD